MKRIENLLKLGMAGLFLLVSCEIPSLVIPPEYINPEAHINVTSTELPGLPGRYDLASEINFNGSASIEGDTAISSYSWDFGDGSLPENGVSVSHIYSTSGVFTVTLTLTDINSQIGKDQIDIVVNTSPVAVITPGDLSVTTDQSVTLYSSSSSDSDGTIESQNWTLGDGTVAAGVSVTHTYTSQGTYPVALTVTDNMGTTDTTYATITVTLPPNELPTAEVGADQDLDYNSHGSIITLDGSSSSDTDGTIISWEWAFSSLPANSLLTNSSLIDLGNGITTFDISGESAAALAEGSLNYNLILTVTDDNGGSDSDTIQITISGTGSVNINIQ